MSSFKKLNKADITTVNYYANKQWNFNYTSSISSSYIIGYVGKNEPFNITGSTTTNGQYQSLVYTEMNHMFYQSYTNLLNTSSLMFNIDTYESASQQRPTASYFDYNINPLLIKRFPVSASNTIRVLSISQDIYGSKILPNSFLMVSSSNLSIRDDGNGNLYTGSEHIGNIFYAHGLVVITNQSSSYQNLNSASISFQNEHIIYENEVRCIVKESDYNLSYNPTLLKYKGQYIVSGSSGYTLTGSFDSTVKDFDTGSFFQPYVTAIGLYNDDNELLMVAKLGKPIVLSSDTDMTFIVKYDT